MRRRSRSRKTTRKSRKTTRKSRKTRKTRKSRKTRKTRKTRKSSRKLKSGRPRDLNKYKAERGCNKQSLKKYRSRPGPPYPANLCRDMRKKGNDGKMYKSVRAKNRGKNYYKWSRT